MCNRRWAEKELPHRSVSRGRYLIAAGEYAPKTRCTQTPATKAAVYSLRWALDSDTIAGARVPPSALLQVPLEHKLLVSCSLDVKPNRLALLY